MTQAVFETPFPALAGLGVIKILETADETGGDTITMTMNSGL